MKNLSLFLLVLLFSFKSFAQVATCDRALAKKLGIKAITEFHKKYVEETGAPPFSSESHDLISGYRSTNAALKNCEYKVISSFRQPGVAKREYSVFVCHDSTSANGCRVKEVKRVISEIRE
jgi:hypothetical protein